MAVTRLLRPMLGLVSETTENSFMDSILHAMVVVALSVSMAVGKLENTRGQSRISQKGTKMNHKVTIITKDGKFLGAVRTGTIHDGENKLQFSVAKRPDHTHHEVEVHEDEMRKPYEQLREALLSKISGKQ
jgi:hypothetical protein